MQLLTGTNPGGSGKDSKSWLSPSTHVDDKEQATWVLAAYLSLRNLPRHHHRSNALPHPLRTSSKGNGPKQ